MCSCRVDLQDSTPQKTDKTDGGMIKNTFARGQHLQSLDAEAMVLAYRLHRFYSCRLVARLCGCAAVDTFLG